MKLSRFLIKTILPTFVAVFLFTNNSFAITSEEVQFYAPWDRVLQKFVQGQSVDYQALKNDSSDLILFLRKAEDLSSEEFIHWSDKQKIAFWLNVYNALIMKIVIEHYPISSGFSLKGLAYPKNSIQQISNVWDLKNIEIFGTKMSPNFIEHDTLRKDFNENRIHFALVCASVGCPPIRAEAYVSERLNRQLEEQVQLFLSDPRKNRKTDDGIEISKIFKWFEEDFLGVDGVKKFISQRKPEWDITQHTRIKYLDYDWSLNDI